MSQNRQPGPRWTLSRLAVPLGWPVAVAAVAPFVSDGSILDVTILLAFAVVPVAGVVRFGVAPVVERHRCSTVVGLGQVYCPGCGEVRSFEADAAELLLVAVPVAAFLWPVVVLWPLVGFLQLDVPLYGAYYRSGWYSPGLWVAGFCAAGALTAATVSVAARSVVRFVRY